MLLGITQSCHEQFAIGTRVSTSIFNTPLTLPTSLEEPSSIAARSRRTASYRNAHEFRRYPKVSESTFRSQTREPEFCQILGLLKSDLRTCACFVTISTTIRLRIPDVRFNSRANYPASKSIRQPSGLFHTTSDPNVSDSDITRLQE